MESNWIFPNLWWQEVDEDMASLTASIAVAKEEISTINGVMTRSKSIKLKTLKDKLYIDEGMLEIYKELREDQIHRTKLILDQLRDFGFACPAIQFEPFEYSGEEFSKLLDECQSIADFAKGYLMQTIYTLSN